MTLELLARRASDRLAAMAEDLERARLGDGLAVVLEHRLRVVLDDIEVAKSLLPSPRLAVSLPPAARRPYRYQP